ncbi:MAG: protein BatD [Bacteroidetes bacterium]|nr:protein BatD [Bacteroidota bacterium]
MKKISFVILLITGMISVLLAQEEKVKFSVELSTDSVLMDNYFQVVFVLENGKGTNFEPPSFSEFFIVSGPNMSSSFSMINGAVTQSASYTYYLEPKDVGNFHIEPANIEIEGTIIETIPVEVIVIDNPDGIIQEPNHPKRFEMNPFPEIKPEPKKKPRKKRKTYRL